MTWWPTFSRAEHPIRVLLACPDWCKEWHMSYSLDLAMTRDWACLGRQHVVYQGRPDLFCAQQHMCTEGSGTCAVKAVCSEAAPSPNGGAENLRAWPEPMRRHGAGNWAPSASEYPFHVTASSSSSRWKLAARLLLVGPRPSTIVERVRAAWRHKALIQLLARPPRPALARRRPVVARP